MEKFDFKETTLFSILEFFFAEKFSDVAEGKKKFLIFLELLNRMLIWDISIEKSPIRIKKQFYLNYLRISLKINNKYSIQHLDRKQFPHILINSLPLLEKLEELFPDKEKVSPQVSFLF